MASPLARVLLSQLGAMTLLISALLRDNKDALLQRWMGRVLEDPKIPAANRLSEPELRDHMPGVIDNIIGALATLEAGGEVEEREVISTDQAIHHAQLRFTERYSVAEAIREMSHFRIAVHDLCAEKGAPLNGKSSRLVHATIDEDMVTVARVMELAIARELRSVAEFRERFVGIVGHDLRSPLAAISLGATFLLKISETPDAIRKVVRRIALSADRMTVMINDLLDFTRSRANGGIPINPQPADLDLICRQVIEELQVAHPDRTIELASRSDGAGCWDPDRLAQVVSNLVGNAITYSPPNTRVRVMMHGDAATVTLEVSNEGAPIPPDVMTSIFEPFRRGRDKANAGRSDGLGLGLFISKTIVDGHHGSLTVDSAAERGTTFTVRLPRECA